MLMLSDSTWASHLQVEACIAMARWIVCQGVIAVADLGSPFGGIFVKDL